MHFRGSRKGSRTLSQGVPGQFLRVSGAFQEVYAMMSSANAGSVVAQQMFMLNLGKYGVC